MRISLALAGLVLSLTGVATAAVTPLPGVSPQRVIAGSYFANAPVFKVTDDSGAPVAGAVVALQMASFMSAETTVNCTNPGGLYPQGYCSATTQADGTVAFSRLRDDFAGNYDVPVTAVLGQRDLGGVTLSFTVDPRGAPATLSLVSGAAQTTVQSSQFPNPFVFKLTRNNDPIAGAMILVQANTEGPTPGSGGNGSANFYTDGNGLASGMFRPDAAVGNGVLDALYVDEEAGAFVRASAAYTVTNLRGGFDLSLQDLWWGGVAENGWGISIIQHEQRLFNVLFAYDDSGNPTWYAQPTSRWVSGIGGQLTADLYSPRAAPWYAYDASKFVPGQPVGFADYIFTNESAAQVSTYFFEPSWNGSTIEVGGHGAAIVPQPFSLPAASPITGLGDMWWGGPEQNGWGMAIEEHPGTLFIAWFTYDDQGKPTWLAMPGGKWTDGSTYTGSIYRTHTAGWANGYDASRLTVTPVGTFTLHFASMEQASIDVQVDGRSVTLPLVRQPF